MFFSLHQPLTLKQILKTKCRPTFFDNLTIQPGLISFKILTIRKKVGWHLDFSHRLMQWKEHKAWIIQIFSPFFTQLTPTKETMQEWQSRPQRLVSQFIKNHIFNNGKCGRSRRTTFQPNEILAYEDEGPGAKLASEA